MTDLGKFQRNPDLIAADMNGEVVMMNLERGAYFGLDGVGSRIWALIESAVAPDEIVAALTAEYAVDAETCKADVERFLAELIENGLAVRA